MSRDFLSENWDLPIRDYLQLAKTKQNKTKKQKQKQKQKKPFLRNIPVCLNMMWLPPSMGGS